MENWLYYLIPAVFIGIVLYIYRPWARKRYEHDAEIPFEDEPPAERDKPSEAGKIPPAKPPERD
jgi:cbb3-type cytochrome oxidase subunit 3